MIRLTIGMKKRKFLDSDLEKLRSAIEDLKRVVYEEMMEIPPSSIRKMRKAGINAAQAGRSLRKIMKKLKKDKRRGKNEYCNKEIRRKRDRDSDSRE